MKTRSTVNACKGSMLLEYALTLCVATVFLAAGLSLFRPGSGYTDYGRRFTAVYQRLLVGISMPIP